MNNEVNDSWGGEMLDIGISHNHSAEETINSPTFADAIRETPELNKPVKVEDFVYKIHERDETINHPAHYNQGRIECIEAIESIGIAEDFCRGNAIKYLWRAKDKSKELEDLRKSAWYVNKLIELVEKRQCSDP